MISDEQLDALIEDAKYSHETYSYMAYVELKKARHRIGALEAELEYNEEGYKKMRHKLALLKEDAERLASAIRHKGSFNEIMEKNFEAVMKHEQVMSEVE